MMLRKQPLSVVAAVVVGEWISAKVRHAII